MKRHANLEHSSRSLAPADLFSTVPQALDPRHAALCASVVIRMVQGYYFAEPISGEAATTLLANGRYA